MIIKQEDGDIGIKSLNRKTNSANGRVDIVMETKK